MIGFIWFVVAITIVAVLTPFITKIYFPHKLTWGEISISIIISIILSITSTLIVMYGGKSNTEIMNGEVVKKSQVEVSCSHSYQVCSGSGDNRVCVTHYEHFNDYDWRVFTTVGELNIDRIDRQGKDMPPRFKKVVIGEHVALESSYIDYLKEQETSLLYKKNHKENSRFEKLIPRYPRVYDYYHIKPVLFSGVRVSKETRDEYNRMLTDELRSLGNQKQVNVVVVFVNTDDVEFGEYLRNEWKNGRKNDQVVVLGVTDYPKVSWGYSFGWSKNQKINSSIKYDINHINEVTPATLTSLVVSNVKKNFTRRPMSEFKSYLWETPVQWWKLLIVIITQLVVNIGVAVYMIRNDITH